MACSASCRSHCGMCGRIFLLAFSQSLLSGTCVIISACPRGACSITDTERHKQRWRKRTQRDSQEKSLKNQSTACPAKEQEPTFQTNLKNSSTTGFESNSICSLYVTLSRMTTSSLEFGHCTLFSILCSFSRQPGY